MAFDRLKQLGRSLFEPPAWEDQTAAAIPAQMRALSDLKAATLAIAATGRSYPDDPTTMAHYADHARAVPDLLTRDPATFTPHETQAHACLTTLLEGGASIDQVWNPKIWCDLSNQKLTGMAIQADHLDQVDGGNSWRFDHSECVDCTWKPMRTHDPERAKGGRFINNTFDGMDDGERCTLSGGTYVGTRIANARGGTLVLGGSGNGGPTVVKGLAINDSRLSLEVHDRANIDELTATDSHIFEIKAVGGRGGPSVSLNRPVIRNTTVAMTSTLQDSVWTGSGDPMRPTFDSSNLSHCDFSGVRLINVCMRNTEVKGLNVSGGQITNLIIDDRLINHPDELASYGVVTDALTRVTVTADGRKAHQNLQVARAGESLRGAIDFAATLPTAPAAPLPERAAAPDPLTIARLKAAQATGWTNNLFVADEQRDLAVQLRQAREANAHAGRANGEHLAAAIAGAGRVGIGPAEHVDAAAGPTTLTGEAAAHAREHMAALQAERAAAAPVRKA